MQFLLFLCLTVVLVSFETPSSSSSSSSIFVEARRRTSSSASVPSESFSLQFVQHAPHEAESGFSLPIDLGTHAHELPSASDSHSHSLLHNFYSYATPSHSDQRLADALNKLSNPSGFLHAAALSPHASEHQQLLHASDAAHSFHLTDDNTTTTTPAPDDNTTTTAPPQVDFDNTDSTPTPPPADTYTPPPTNCSQVNCTAMLDGVSSDQCDACTASVCCGWCNNDADPMGNTGSCMNLGTKDGIVYDVMPSNCNPNAPNTSWMQVCGMPALYEDQYSMDGSLNCTGVVCSSATNCNDCLLTTSLCCSWCSSGQCVNIGPSADTPDLSQCAAPARLMLTTCEDCSTVVCNATYPSCDACSTSYCCGWCFATSSCQNSNPNDITGSTPVYPALCVDPISGTSSLDASGNCPAPRGDGVPVASTPNFTQPFNNSMLSSLTVDYGTNAHFHYASTSDSEAYDPFNPRPPHAFSAMAVSYTAPIDANGFAIDPILNIASSKNAKACSTTVNGASVVSGFLPTGQTGCNCLPGWKQDDSGACSVADDMQNTYPAWALKLIPWCSGEGDQVKVRNFCDAPEVIYSYIDAINAKTLPYITLDYALIVIANDDGSNPSMNPQQVIDQQSVLTKAFDSSLIKWNGRVQNFQSSAWRAKTAVDDSCTLTTLTNGQCDQKCNLDITGFDGGDCKSPPASGTCNAAMMSNGACDAVCNNKANNWDGGDCCPQNNPLLSSTTCKNPNATTALRAYYTFADLVSAVGQTNDKQMNVFITNVGGAGTMGVATFPFSANPFTLQSGAKFYSTNYWGKVDTYSGATATHEFGHAMGLQHVFTGPQYSACSDVCQELVDDAVPVGTMPTRFDKGMWVGDLHSDTRPMPEYYQCNDCTNCKAAGEQGASTAQCSEAGGWNNTPWHNWMSYGADTCLNQFTPQQSGRMRCYADSVYLNKWYTTTVPPPVILRPVNTSFVASGSSGTVTIQWLPALAPSSIQSQFQYVLQRVPAFTGNANGITISSGFQYSDSDLAVSTTYTYFVTTMWNGVSAPTQSPPLTFISPPSFSTSATSHLHLYHNLHPMKVTYRAPTPQCLGSPVCGGSTKGTCNTATGVCTCKPGYYGPDCSSPCPTCSGHGMQSCTKTGGCMCQAGWMGTNCTQKQCPVGNQNKMCSGNGNCTSLGVCLCKKGWGGLKCDRSIQLGCPMFKNMTCAGRGVCKQYYGLSYCQCNSSDITGVACQNRCPSTRVNGVNVTCSGNGICAMDGSCICRGPYRGVDCSTQKPATYITTDCSSKTTEISDGVISFRIDAGVCNTKFSVTIGDPSVPLTYPNGTTPIGPPREMRPSNLKFNSTKNGKRSKVEVWFPLGERSKTRFVNLSNAAICLYTTTDGKTWRCLNSTKVDWLASAVGASIDSFAIFVPLALSSNVPVTSTIDQVALAAAAAGVNNTVPKDSAIRIRIHFSFAYASVNSTAKLNSFRAALQNELAQACYLADASRIQITNVTMGAKTSLTTKSDRFLQSLSPSSPLRSFLATAATTTTAAPTKDPGTVVTVVIQPVSLAGDITASDASLILSAQVGSSDSTLSVGSFSQYVDAAVADPTTATPTTANPTTVATSATTAASTNGATTTTAASATTTASAGSTAAAPSTTKTPTTSAVLPTSSGSSKISITVTMSTTVYQDTSLISKLQVLIANTYNIQPASRVTINLSQSSASSHFKEMAVTVTIAVTIAGDSGTIANAIVSDANSSSSTFTMAMSSQLSITITSATVTAANNMAAQLNTSLCMLFVVMITVIAALFTQNRLF